MARRLIPADQRPEWVPVVADWLVTEWAHLYPDWDHTAAIAELLARGASDGPPCTWLLFDDEDLDAGVLGSVGLSLGGELEDTSIAPIVSGVWVVNLFVAPGARGRGHGTALLDHAIAHAIALGVDTLLLTTEHSAPHYRTLGWIDLGTATLNGHPSTVMTRSLLHGSPVAP